MTAENKLSFAAILLAAGGSSRLGRPKQLLTFEGETLLRRMGRTLAATQYSPIVVVLGAEAEEMLEELDGLTVEITINPAWKTGLSSSIKCGIEKVVEIAPDLDGVLIALCDQPLITADMFDSLARTFVETHPSVVAASYDGIGGVPALFSKAVFASLCSLEGDKGARQLIRERSDAVLIDLPAAAVDIDTETDLRRIGEG